MISKKNQNRFFFCLTKNLQSLRFVAQKTGQNFVKNTVLTAVFVYGILNTEKEEISFL